MTGSISGGTYFLEFSNFDVGQWIGYSAGLLMVLLGVFTVSKFGTGANIREASMHINGSDNVGEECRGALIAKETQ